MINQQINQLRQKTETTQPAPEAKQEAAKPAEATPAQEQADYNKLLEWNASQAQAQMAAQQKTSI